MVHVSATTAMRSLEAARAALSSATERVATGLAVRKSSDAPATWALASRSRSDTMTLQTIRESLSVSRLTVETIHLHVSHVLDMVREVKGLFFLAQDEGTDVEALADRIEEIRNHTYGFINKQINEQHYIDGGHLGSPVSVGASHTNFWDVSPTVGAGNRHTATTLAEQTAIVATIEQRVVGAMAAVGSFQARLDTQDRFLGFMIDARERATGAMVDADVEAESARLEAEEARVAIAIEELAIANTERTILLRLFAADA